MFPLSDPGVLSDGCIELVLKRIAPEDPQRGYVPAYHFDIVLSDSSMHVGTIDLRIGQTPELVSLGGQVGYAIDEPARGRRYATRALRLLLPLAKRHGMDELWITCNPENIASRKTCEAAGAQLVEIVPLPESSDMYAAGDRWKCRYRLALESIDAPDASGGRRGCGDET